MSKKGIEYLAEIGNSFGKELKLIFSDFSVLSTYIVFNIVVVVFYAFIYSHEVVKNLPIAVVNQDNTDLSQKLVRMIDATEQVNVVYSVETPEKAEELYLHKKIKGYVVIPQNFSYNIQKGLKSDVSVFCDASIILYYKQVYTAVSASVGTFSAGIEINKLVAGGLTQKQAMALRRPIESISRPMFNISGGYATFLMPMVLLIALQTLQISAMGVLGGTLRERKKFTETFSFSRRIFGSIPVVLGRSGSYLLISSILIIIEMALVLRLFDLPQKGSISDILVFLIPFNLSVSFIGMSMLNFFKHREDAIMFVTMISIPSLFLCGISWPTTAFPVWIKIISCFFPTTFGVKGFLELTQYGASFVEIKNVWYCLWGQCFFYFLLAVLTTKKFAFRK